MAIHADQVAVHGGSLGLLRSIGLTVQVRKYRTTTELG